MSKKITHEQMREIKFRVWHNIEKRYYKVETLNFLMGEIVLIPYKCVSFGFDEVILEQYTGLKDKNGVEIYEGDIVKRIDGLKGLITFKNGRYVLLYNNGKGDRQWFIGESGSRVVIGNIHDNGELLQVDYKTKIKESVKEIV